MASNEVYVTTDNILVSSYIWYNFVLKSINKLLYKPVNLDTFVRLYMRLNLQPCIQATTLTHFGNTLYALKLSRTTKIAVTMISW